MKIKILLSFIISFCIIFTLCGCFEKTYSYDEYRDLESDYEELNSLYCDLEEELEFQNNNLISLYSFLETIDTENSVPTFNYGDTWYVGNYFKFSYTYNYDETFECDELNYNVATFNEEIVEYYWGECQSHPYLNIKNFFVIYTRSDGEYEIQNSILGDDIAIFLEEYDYDYTADIFINIDDNIYRAKFNLSSKDIRN